jgi:hypothetical protein
LCQISPQQGRITLRQCGNDRTGIDQYKRRRPLPCRCAEEHFGRWKNGDSAQVLNGDALVKETRFRHERWYRYSWVRRIRESLRAVSTDISCGPFEHALPGASPGGNLAVDNGDLFPAVVLDIDHGQVELWFRFLHRKTHNNVTFQQTASYWNCKKFPPIETPSRLRRSYPKNETFQYNPSRFTLGTRQLVDVLTLC